MSYMMACSSIILICFSNLSYANLKRSLSSSLKLLIPLLLLCFMLFWGFFVDALTHSELYISAVSTFFKCILFSVLLVVYALTVRNVDFRRSIKKNCTVLIFCLLIFGLLSLFFPLATYLGQSYRGVNFQGLRATAIFAEPGMLANTAVLLYCLRESATLAFYSNDDVTRRFDSLTIVMIIILLLSQSLVSLIFIILICCYRFKPRFDIYSIVKVSVYAVVFFLIVFIVVSNFFPILIDRVINGSELIMGFSTTGLTRFGNSGDGSLWLKLSNLHCTFDRDLSRIFIGEGIFGNARVTYTEFLKDGRVDISSGCAWINSNGVINLWFFQYGIVSLILLVNLYYLSLKVEGFPVLLTVLLLTRVGESPIFYVVLIVFIGFLINDKKNDKYYC
ncbi:hypothetical protein FCV60_09220 [Vibrio sp. F13]|uniref:hypothetical protein n=1 Tax=Vibrio sp. F13 TaxID=2070777 RepID=UPI0010BDFB68|nr:hypothetical protein [Vibrio sp. F13]TKF54484.1 hypothetical protein FCV60_09220 [Vibrio sp. F13]